MVIRFSTKKIHNATEKDADSQKEARTNVALNHTSIQNIFLLDLAGIGSRTSRDNLSSQYRAQ